MSHRKLSSSDYSGLGLAEPALEVGPVAARLRAAAEVAARKARSLGRPVPAWTAVRISPADPVHFFEQSVRIFADPMLWWRPDEGFSLVGAGRAWAFTGEGAERVRHVGESWRVMLRDAVGSESAGGEIQSRDRGAGPVMVGGFSFVPEGSGGPEWEGFPAGLLVLPRLTVASAGRSTWLTLAVTMRPDGRDAVDADEEVEKSLEVLAGLLRADPAERRKPVEHPGPAGPAREAESVRQPEPTRRVEQEFPAADQWKETVAAAARAVREARLRKVVLARGVRVRAAGFDPADTLRRLRAGYPTCTLFAVARGDRCFLGATPERLVRVRGGEVSAMALAGSAPRGETEDEDRRLGAMLLDSPKDRIEHAVVVEVLREALSAACASVSVAATPTLLRFHNVQHLYTPIVARLRDRSTALDLAGRLHPTPAVGGVPRDEALEWIRRHEGLDRGWYAGPVGWMDGAGEGEFAVAIRSALIRRDEAVLYAGCGIVGDSDPDEEYAESNLKLRPMLSALAAPGGVNADAAMRTPMR